MAVENGNGGLNISMPVAPAYAGYGMPYAYGGYNNNGGFFGNNGDWIILFLFAMMFGGGWGMGGFGGFGGFGGMWGAEGMFPWLLASNNNTNDLVTSGFNNAAVTASLGNIQNAITSGFGDVQLGVAGVNQNISNGTAAIQNSLCSGFAGTTAAITGAQNALAQQMYANQISDLERSFAAQTASTAGMNNLQSQLATCCCNQSANTADLKYTIATENCATRTADANNARDIIDAQTRGTQAILDKLCALELDNVKAQLAQAQRENVGLQNQLSMANLAASQTAQTAELRASQATTANQLVSELRSCPIPSQPVYGNQPIFTCPQTVNTCGCNTGCGAF